MKLPDIEVIQFKPIGGTPIDVAKREAIALAIEYRCDVEFGFNDRWHKVEYRGLVNCVRERNDN